MKISEKYQTKINKMKNNLKNAIEHDNLTMSEISDYKQLINNVKEKALIVVDKNWNNLNN